MLINRIIATNFKTYLNLDLDISVEEDKPIILIGGENGGGKTTLFEAIYGALYGLNISSPRQFRELLNAGILDTKGSKIILELHFSGQVLNEVKKYVLTRTYMLNSFGNPAENVKLNMNGDVFKYGTVTPPAQRAEQEAQVNKIIKANLPQELSRYFLFDAMEAGNLLKEDQLNRVIKENIENVMGFNKYMQLAAASENLFQEYTAQRLKIENEKTEYTKLIEEKKKLDAAIKSIQSGYDVALQYSAANRELFQNMKSGLNQETTINNKIEQAKLQVENILQKENLFRGELEDFIKNIELYVCVPKLVDAIRAEVNLVLKEKNENRRQANLNIPPEQVEAIGNLILEFLKENNPELKDIAIGDLVDYVLASANNSITTDEYAALEYSDVKVLEEFLARKTINPFPRLSKKQLELGMDFEQIPGLQGEIEQMKSRISGNNYEIIRDYEENEKNIKKLLLALEDEKAALQKVEKRLHQFDIQTSREHDLKYDTLAKLKMFFEDVANQLLTAKKQTIELKMKEDLNINLTAYRDVIDRVELSENLSNLTFKLFHTAGNEIYLNQLNTASKQIVVQVLLKALHEFGDYDPPVMIDTVMGVLDEASRASVLENYFPELSHQTLLLSSDSEIRVDKDFDKIGTNISKCYTLKRDREKQLTEIVSGYFGKHLGE